jgi:hypothetical protein
MRSILALLMLATLTGCASLPQACLPPAQDMASAELFFGRKIGPRVAVTDADFARFTAEEITPRFPDGLTVLDAKGQWRDSARGALIHEPSKLVLIVFRDEPQRRADLSAVAEAYKAKFRQQSVLTAVRSVCVTN